MSSQSRCTHAAVPAPRPAQQGRLRRLLPLCAGGQTKKFPARHAAQSVQDASSEIRWCPPATEPWPLLDASGAPGWMEAAAAAMLARLCSREVRAPTAAAGPSLKAGAGAAFGCRGRLGAGGASSTPGSLLLARFTPRSTFWAAAPEPSCRCPSFGESLRSGLPPLQQWGVAGQQQHHPAVVCIDDLSAPVCWAAAPLLCCNWWAVPQQQSVASRLNGSAWAVLKLPGASTTS